MGIHTQLQYTGVSVVVLTLKFWSIQVCGTAFPGDVQKNVLPMIILDIVNSSVVYMMTLCFFGDGKMATKQPKHVIVITRAC